MIEFSLEEVAPLSPACFLHVGVEIPKEEGFKKNPYQKPYLLPSFSELLDQESFAQVAMCYSNKGVWIAVEVEKSFEEVFFPKVEQGDGIEIFIDTRDVKSVGSMHKFCHHFIFLPKPVTDFMACEVTRLRVEDSHPLADPSLLHVNATFSKNSYEMRIFIEADALYGFDPDQTHRIGFAYKIHRYKKSTQDFSLSSQDVQIEKYPQLWASITLE